MLPLNPFQSFVLLGTVADIIVRPNNHRFVPVPVNVWRIETCYKRAPGDICHTNTRSNPMKTLYRTATPHSTPLKTTHGFRPLLGRCDDPNHRWWTDSKIHVSHFFACHCVDESTPTVLCSNQTCFPPHLQGFTRPKLLVPTPFDPLSSFTATVIGRLGFRHTPW